MGNCFSHVAQIISGGQTGVDRAALDFAIRHDIPYGGWVPKGGRAEDFPAPYSILDHYPNLWEHEESDYRARTRANVNSADMTLILTGGAGENCGGTEYTCKVAREKCAHTIFNKQQYMHVDTTWDVPRVATVLQHLPEGRVVNIAGPRESNCPGIHQNASAFLEALWNYVI